MKPPEALSNSVKKITYHILTVMTHYDLRSFKLCVFLVLLSERPMTVGLMSKMLGCSEANITGLRKTLESRNLVSAERPETDNRKVYLSLTNTGQEFLEHYYGSKSLPDS